MKIELLKEHEYAAREKWKEYTAAFKKTRDPLYNDMKKVYHAIKKGAAVIDVSAAIKSAGVRDNGYPWLAIAPANKKIVHLRYRNDGSVFYSPYSHWGKRWNGNLSKGEIEIANCFPAIKQTVDLKAPIPIIPPRLRPATLHDDYYILWEVDSWTVVPSKDPYLLRRITVNLFAVVAAWDLTDIEIAVMAGRVK